MRKSLFRRAGFLQRAIQHPVIRTRVPASTEETAVGSIVAGEKSISASAAVFFTKETTVKLVSRIIYLFIHFIYLFIYSRLFPFL